jgi:hypothetical protein
MARQRLSILERYEAELTAFMLDRENGQPYVPGSRCRAVVFWFATKRITESADVEDIIHKLHMGDRMMQNECLYILSGENVPGKLKKLLFEHLDRIRCLQDINIGPMDHSNPEMVL